MVNIEPYQYQKVTNVKEHNDIVAKINEIVDVINNSGADTLGPRIDKLETDVSAIDSAVKIQYQDIASIKDKDQAQDNNIGTLDAQVKGITESLVSDVNIIDGTTVGKFKVRLDREKAPSINSNDYDLQKATSIELVQGSGPSMLKAQITLSDGTILISDDFLFTTEAIGTDVYISSFVFKNGNVAGTISADIGLSNGSTLEANNFTVPMDPSLISTVQDLSTRLTAVEGGSVAGFKELEAQVNTNKTNIATLTTEIDGLDIQKADQSNPAQTIKADTTDLRTVKLRGSTDAVGSYLQFNADANKPVRMEYHNGTEVADSGYIATVDSSGNPKNFSTSAEYKIYTGEISDLFEITSTSFRLKKDIIVRVIRCSFSNNTMFITETRNFVFPKSGKEWLSNGTGRGSITQSYMCYRNSAIGMYCSIDADGSISTETYDIKTTTWEKQNSVSGKTDTYDNRLNSEMLPNNGSSFTKGSGGYYTIYTVYTL